MPEPGPKVRQRHPAYKTSPVYLDPIRGLLAAVVLQVVKDADPGRRVKPYYRESARLFLADQEGRAWLRYFGIPADKIQAFIDNGYTGASWH